MRSRNSLEKLSHDMDDVLAHKRAAIRVHTATKEEFNLKKVHVWITSSVLFALFIIIVNISRHTFEEREKKRRWSGQASHCFLLANPSNLQTRSRNSFSFPFPSSNSGIASARFMNFDGNYENSSQRKF